MWWRCAPGRPAAEVAGLVLVVAIGAQRRHLASCPHLIGHAIGGQAVIAEAPGDQAAVHAWPVEHRWATHGENLHLLTPGRVVGLHGASNNTSNGWRGWCPWWLLA